MAYAKVTASIYNENDVRCLIPEALDPIIKIWAPELKSSTSYWQFGTSTVSRVKISALVENVDIHTKEAKISGTASENYEPVDTVGTVFIHVCNNFYIKAYVTRTTDAAPLVVDGIIGLNVLRTGRWDFDKTNQTLVRLSGTDSYGFSRPALPGSSFITDYVEKLRDRIRSISIRRENKNNPSILLRFAEIKKHLPLDHVNNSLISDVLFDYTDCFCLPGDKIEPTKHFRYPIKTCKSLDPIAVEQPVYTQEHWDRIEVIISDLLRQEIIRKTASPWNFPMDLIKKKADSRGNVEYRIFVNYRRLNRRSKSESCPIPSIVDAIDELHGSKFFSVLDLASAGYQIALEPDDCRKTAFSTLSGRYEFQRMPAGIKNGSKYIQRMMNKVVNGMRERVFVCHDDILIHSSTIAEHEIALRKLLSRLREYGLKLKPGKSQLLRNSVMYLGHLVTDAGLLPDPAKIEKLRTQRMPTNADDLRSYLGLLCTHKRFLKGYAGRAKPMWDMLEYDTFEWSPEAIVYFKRFQSILFDDLTLRYPDWSRPFVVKTGCSKYGIYAGLMQDTMDHSPSRPIAWASRTFKPSEYHSELSNKKLLASAYGTDTFRRYLQNTSSLDEIIRKLSINE